MRPARLLLPLLIVAAGAARGGDGVLEFARKELLRELPPPAPVPATAAQLAAEDALAKREAGNAFGFVEVAVRLRTPAGTPLGGVAVVAWHETFDLRFGPAVSDGRGEALLRAPRGPWRLDLVTNAPVAGSLLFARTRFAVEGPGVREVEIGKRREVRFRGRLGEARAAHVVTLAVPDLSFHRSVEALQGQLVIDTIDDAPLLLQAGRRPGDEEGYLLRATIGPGTTVVETESDRATEHLFKGNPGRRVEVRYASADALPLDLAFTAARTARVRLMGLASVVVAIDVDLESGRYGFHPRPFPLDGTPREFAVSPPFLAAVGQIPNEREQYGGRVNSVSFRPLLTTATGLLLRGDEKGVYSIAWEQRLDGALRASGSARPCSAVSTPPVDPKRFPDLRYRLRILGPGENRQLEAAPQAPSAEVVSGKVRTWCFPALEPNARMWAAGVDRAVRAYEETCAVRTSRVDVVLSIHMPLPVVGMGGYNGDSGWMWLPEEWLYGFAGPSAWNGLLCHELGHVFRYGHDDALQAKLMLQAGRRAGRRHEALRPGMERVPEAEAFRPILEALSRGEPGDARASGGEPDPVGEAAADATSRGVFVPNLEVAGDDGFLDWYYRAAFGEKAVARRAANAEAWSWHLTRKGFLDEEIQVAIASQAAGASLAWLARMRGIAVRDHRVAGAMRELSEAPPPSFDREARERALREWRGAPSAGDDLAALERRLRDDLGERRERVAAILRIAREHLARGDAAAGERLLVEALDEARRGGSESLDAALRDGAPLWAMR